jgi:hypothetical protein
MCSSGANTSPQLCWAVDTMIVHGAAVVLLSLLLVGQGKTAT